MMTGKSQILPGAGTGFYTRQATGLVRELGLSANTAISLSFMSIPYAALTATVGALAFPSANLPLVMVIAGLLCIPIVFLFGWLGTVMPRSGGDYVFVSRTINPVIGFAASFNLVVWFLLVLALFGAILSSFGLSDALAGMGVAMHNATLLSWSTAVTSRGWEMGMGSAALIISALIVSLRLRTWTRIFQVIFWVSLAGLLVAIGLTLISSNADFQAALPSFGGTYNGILSAAGKAGYQLNAPFSFWATLLAAPLGFFFFGFGIVPVYSAGEIRSPRRTLIRALLTAVVIGGVIVFFMMWSAVHTFGHDFLGAATYLSTNAPAQYPLPSSSFLFLFQAMLTHNGLLIAIMGISFVLAFFAAFPPSFLIVSRCLFAWSFDRILPTRVADVSDRTHSPVIANLITLIVSLGFLALIVYGPASILTIAYGEVAGVTLTWMMAAIAGAILPYRRRELYQASAIGRDRLFGLPAITVVGVVSLAVYLLFLISVLTNTALGVVSTPGIVALIVVALLPFPIYGIAFLIQRNRGIDLRLAFQELPPE